MRPNSRKASVNNCHVATSDSWVHPVSKTFWATRHRLSCNELIHPQPWASAHSGKWGPWKNGWKIKKRKHAVFYVYVIFWKQSGQAGVENGAICWPHICSDILQNAPFRSQIFKIFFASGSKGALTPLTKILRTFLTAAFHVSPMSFKSFRALEFFFTFPDVFSASCSVLATPMFQSIVEKL